MIIAIGNGYVACHCEHLTARERVKRIANALGATIEQTGSASSILTIQVDAPNGYHWQDGGVSALKAESRPTTESHVTLMWADLANRMAMGLRNGEALL